MKTGDWVSGCACCGMSRRRFLAGCGACVGAAGLLTVPSRVATAGTGKVRIRIVYSLHAVKQPGPDWPNVGFDFAPVMDRINGELAKRCPGFEFVSSMAAGPEQAKKILDEDKTAGIDGYLVYQMNAGTRWCRRSRRRASRCCMPISSTAAAAGSSSTRPASSASNAPNVGFVASSRIEDLVAAVKCFDLVKKGGSVADFVAATAKARTSQTPKPGDLQCKPDHADDDFDPRSASRKMKESKILAVRGQEIRVRRRYHGHSHRVGAFAEVNDAWKAADKDQSAAVADRWQKTATEVDGVSRETLETSAAMYLGMKDVLKKHGANAITMNCLGGFYGGHIHAYPCLGFHELCNEGLVGACECDMRSTATMAHDQHLDAGPARLHLRPGHRHRQAPDHLRPLRRAEQDVRPARARPTPSRS